MVRLVPHDILDVMGVEALAEYLVNEIQDVYRLQGVDINDKHIETIARQMMQKVEVLSKLVTQHTLWVRMLTVKNLKLRTRNMSLMVNKCAVGKPVLQGITKASLQTRSFISAASFQETTRVLTEAAVNGKVDELKWLKRKRDCGTFNSCGNWCLRE